MDELESVRLWFAEELLATNQSKQILGSIETSAEGGASIPFLAALSGKVAASLKTDTEYRREIRRRAERDPVALIRRANILLDAVHKALAPRRTKLCVVFDNLEKTNPTLVDRALHAYMHAYEIPHVQHATFAGQFRPIAVQQVRRDLVLSAVVEQQSLRATEAEIDERIQRIAASRNIAPGEVYKQLQEGGRLAELERSITEEKAFTWLLGQSTVNQG